METINLFGIGFGFIAVILLMSVGIAFSIFMIYVPYLVAKSRDVAKNKRTIIIILGWAGIFFGITWIIALILAFIYEPEVIHATLNTNQYHTSLSDVEALERLASLKDRGVITEEEFNHQKAIILKHVKNDT